MITADLVCRVAEDGDTGNIGAIVAITPADIETDHIVLSQLSAGGLDIHQCASFAEADTAQHRRGIVLDGASMKGTGEVELSGALAGNGKRGLYRALGDFRDPGHPGHPSR